MYWHSRAVTRALGKSQDVVHGHLERIGITQIFKTFETLHRFKLRISLGQTDGHVSLVDLTVENIVFSSVGRELRCL